MDKVLGEFINSHDEINSCAEIITVRLEDKTMTKQNLPCFVGISNSTAGSKGISMNLVVIPPGASA